MHTVPTLNYPFLLKTKAKIHSSSQHLSLTQKYSFCNKSKLTTQSNLKLFTKNLFKFLLIRSQILLFSHLDLLVQSNNLILLRGVLAVRQLCRIQKSRFCFCNWFEDTIRMICIDLGIDQQLLINFSLDDKPNIQFSTIYRSPPFQGY
jgi:hypothetical protein